jgi:hypothetical protein
MRLAAISLSLSVNSKDVRPIAVNFNNPEGSLMQNIIDQKAIISWYSLNDWSLRPGDTLFSIRVKSNGMSGNWALQASGDNSLADINGDEYRGVRLVYPDRFGVGTADPKLSIFPNPVKDEARLNVFLSSGGYAEIILLDALSRKVKTVFQGILPDGHHQLHTDLSHLEAGIYFLKLVCSQGEASSSVMQKILISR